MSWTTVSKNILVPAFLGVFGAPGSGAGSATEPLFEAHDDTQPLLVVTRHIDHNEEDDESDDQDGDDNTNRDTVLTLCCKGVQLTPNHNHIYLFFNNINFNQDFFLPSRTVTINSFLSINIISLSY